MLNVLDVIQPLPQQVDHVRVIQADKDSAAFTASSYDVPVTQPAQLVRDSGFGDADPFHQLTDTDLTIQQASQNQQAGGVT
jgi:hypothetical protein